MANEFLVNVAALCAKMPPMRPVLLAALISVLVFSPPGLAQVGGGHMLFGDFKVDDTKVSGPKPETFHILLYTSGGRLVSRDVVSNNGRYRFFEVANGDYDIVVEIEAQEVARIRVTLADVKRTDIRKDIELEWRETFKSKAKTEHAVSAESYYEREAANASRFEKAQEATRKNDYDQAISLFLQIVASDPKDFISWTELGTLNFKKDKLSEAEKCYLRALAERPSLLLALLNLGKLRLSQKNFDGSIEVLDQAVKKDAQSAEANYLLGEAYLQVKKGSKAVVYLNEAIRLDPVGKAEAHLRLGLLYNGAGAKDRAALEYEKFLAKKPDYPQRAELEKYISENKKR